MNKDKVIVLIIYLVTFGIVAYYNLSHPIINDTYWEYQNYLLNIKQGWMYRDTLANSSVVMTWLPAMIQRVTHLDAYTLFRVFPVFFYPLMPVFTYLIARKYMSVKLAVIAPIVIMCSSYILFFPDIGSNAIAFGFMAGMIWALLSKKIGWAMLFAILIVFTHYSGAMISVFILLLVLIGSLIWNKKGVKIALITFCALIVFTGVWEFGIAKFAGNAMFNSALQTETPNNGEKITGFSSNYFNKFGKEFVDPTSRDTFAQRALGLDFTRLPIPSKLEVIFNWLVVLMITFGLLLILRSKLGNEFKIMLSTLFAVIIIVLAIPQFSKFYGTERAYFVASIVLASCVPMSVEWIAKKIHLPFYLIVALVLVPYALCTLGLIYLPFGLVKNIVVSAP